MSCVSCARHTMSQYGNGQAGVPNQTGRMSLFFFGEFISCHDSFLMEYLSTCKLYYMFSSNFAFFTLLRTSVPF